MIECKLEAGKTYYLKTYMLESGDIGDFVLSTSSFSFDSAEKVELSVDTEKEVNIGAGEYKLLTYTPSEAGKYFFSISNSANEARYTLMNSDYWIFTAYNSTNTNLTYDMQAGQEYILKAKFSESSASGSITVKIAKYIPVTGIQCENLTLYPGDNGWFEYKVLPENATQPSPNCQEGN